MTNPVILLLMGLINLSSGLSCFECDDIPGSSRQPCPGVNLVRFGSGTNACIIYRLDSGRIVYQGDGSELCQEKRSFLQQIIYDNFNQNGNAMCCRSDGCNKDIPDDFDSSSMDELFLEQVRHSSSSSPPQQYETRSSSSSSSSSFQLTMLFSFLLVGSGIH